MFFIEGHELPIEKSGVEAKAWRPITPPQGEGG